MARFRLRLIPREERFFADFASLADELCKGGLFDREGDAIAIFEWKEILDMLEGATDRCKDVATAIEGILVKHA